MCSKVNNLFCLNNPIAHKTFISVSRIKYKQRKKGATKKLAEKNFRSDVFYGLVS